ncbi:MAG: MFS transporter [Deltaproteobacteria bacterium]
MRRKSFSGTYAAFGYRDFNLFEAARVCSTLATQMQAVAVSWHMYHLTGRPLDLGLAGLVQFLPAVLLSLWTGDLVDRHPRRAIVIGSHAAFAVCALWLCYVAMHPALGVRAIYAALLFYGVVRAFAGPANQAILPDIIPVEHYGSSVAWSQTIWQGAAIAGPALGGALYAATRHAAPVFATPSVLSVGAVALMFATRVRTTHLSSHDPGWTRLFAGLRFVWSHKLVLGAISLDLFAVLLGGAVALLPIFARDYLHAGAWGLGLLRAAPAMGAAVMAVFLAHEPLRHRAGVALFASVAVFGLATIVFGLSRSFALSLVALAVVGAADMISVVVRHTLVQLGTPREMRGRVSAVNSVFIGASNQLGEFESGVTAQWFGAVPAVIIGGLGTILVVALWAWMFPSLRKVDRLIEPEKQSVD